MPDIISFRTPDSFVEIDGVRKPLATFPNLKVTRNGEPIPGLLEVNFGTGWVTVGRPGVYQPWLANPQTPEGREWQETISNIRVAGLHAEDIIVTGADMRLARRPPAKTPAAKRPEAPPPPRVNADAAAEERRRIIEGLPALKVPSDPVPVGDFLAQMESL